MDLTENAIEKLLYTGRSQQQIQDDPNGEPFVILPNGSVVNLAPYYPPRTLRAAVEFNDADSFCEYVNRFKFEDTTIFAQVSPEQGADLVAVLDYHHAGKDGEHQPRRCSHLARYLTEFTPEYQRWMNANRRTMSQVEFATWLEDNMKLFVTPEGSDAVSGAQLLELVETLHGHQNARFSGTVRLQTGATSVSYEEDVEVKGNLSTRADKLALPKKIVGGFAVFKGGSPYAVSARLKTRIENRQLRLWFETEDVPQLIIENVETLLADIEAKTAIKPLLGRTIGAMVPPPPSPMQDLSRAANYRGPLSGAF